MLTGFLFVIILLGALQGIILGGMLFFTRKSKYYNRFLAGLIWLISLASFNLYMAEKFSSNWLWANLSVLIPLVQAMAFGPMLYLYVQAYLNPSFRFEKKHRKHFYAVIVDFVPAITVITYVVGLLTKTIHLNNNGWGNFIDTYNVYADIPRWASITWYTWLSWRYISAFKKRNDIQPGSTMAYKYRWLLQIIRAFFAFQCLWLLFLVPYVIPAYTDKLLDAVGWYPIYIPMAVLTYWLGIRGYIVSQHLDVEIKPEAKKKPAGIHTQLTLNVIEQIAGALKNAMERDKLYLDAELNLEAVVKHTGIPQKNISAVLNQHLHKSFNEFVNEYRVNEVRQKMMEPANSNLTISGIAYDCGFNSQATFQRAFKTIIGVTPTEYLSANRQLAGVNNDD